MKQTSIFVDENGKEYKLLIGQNQRENDILLRSCEPDDLWFHLDDISSPHFILCTNGDIIPKRYLNVIGGMFVDYKNKLPRRYKVIYTELKNVKLTKTLGTVIPSKVRTLKI
jgi:predicted ribosome quality control (RQC) complex YloA/Tae2 family protein